MKRLLLTLLLVCNTAYAERWVQVYSWGEMDIDLVTQKVDGVSWPSYRLYDREYNSEVTWLVDCRLGLHRAVSVVWYNPGRKTYWRKEALTSAWQEMPYAIARYACNN